MLPIALDAMGGDNAPEAIVEGARLAQEKGIPVTLFGPSEKLEKLNAGYIEVVEANEVIPMEAEPSSAVRKMKNASVVVAAQAVKNKKASALVSAGNTGAVMASALLRMGRIRGVIRPAIAVPFPASLSPESANADLGKKYNLLLDCGANADCQPKWIFQFAQMGVVHYRDRFHVEKPRVGLVSIGEEPSKGSNLVKESYEILNEPEWQKKLNCTFVGNIEGRDLLADEADVLVTDGFTGNVMLKTVEGTAGSLAKDIVKTLTESGNDKALEALAPLYADWDPSNTGGAVLLGVKGVCIISHGASSPEAVLNAVSLAAEFTEAGSTEHLKEAISS